MRTKKHCPRCGHYLAVKMVKFIHWEPHKYSTYMVWCGADRETVPMTKDAAQVTCSRCLKGIRALGIQIQPSPSQGSGMYLGPRAASKT